MQDGDDLEADACELWPEHMATLKLFLACRHQIETASLAGFVGLRAESVEAVLRMRGVARTERGELCEDLCMMARAAAEILSARQAP